MSRSTIIFGTLALAFVMYITMRGQLPAYFGLFSGKASSGSVSNTSPTSTSSSSNSLGGALAQAASLPKQAQDIIAKANNMLGTMGLGGLGI